MDELELLQELIDMRDAMCDQDMEDWMGDYDREVCGLDPDAFN